jgi:CPA2 family monovalent cation:H+ antiporter-2
MLIDPALMLEHATAIAVLTLAVIVGKISGVSIGAFLTGHGTRLSLQAGMSLAQIGEFSFIIAALGLALDATGSFLYPVAVAVSAITTLTTPWLIRASGPFANLVDRKLPKRMQTFVALYGSWIERVRAAPRRETTGAAVRRWIALLLGDMTILVVVTIATSLVLDTLVDAITARTGASRTVAVAMVVAADVLITLPFVIGIVRIARRLAAQLAQAAFPGEGEGRVDFAAAPRGALLITLELAIVLCAGLPVLAITQPFVQGYAAPLFALGILVTLTVALWRTATNLDGHVRAGAQMVLEVLAAQSRSQRAAQSVSLQQVDAILPGLGAPTSLPIAAASPAAGKSLSELNLRGLTGATVLAIQRGDVGNPLPSAHEVLQAGDVLAIAGTEESIEAARALLAPPTP